VLVAGLAMGAAPTGAAAMTPLAGGGWTASDAYRAYVASTRNGVAVAATAAHAATATATGAAATKTAASTMIPAFARKYGLRCSACHTFFPELNSFGQQFRDNGYQLMNERDSPIWQNPSYFPLSIRITPQWHLETTNHQLVDAVPGDATTQVEKHVTANGFDLSGTDIWTAGTLYKNISFVMLLSSDNLASFHFEAAYVRFDNIMDSPWLNIKFGKFELDNLISEKRFLFLSANGGLYQSYHFSPVGDANDFGIGDNQLGISLEGHNVGSYTRYSGSLLSSTSGNPGLVNGSSYDGFFTFSQAFQAGAMGLERIGAYAYVGQRSTVFPTSLGAPIPGDAQNNKPFYRIGAAGDFFLGKLELLPFYLHGYDNAFLGTSTPGNDTLPTGAKAPTWNAGFLEAHFYVNERFVALGRYELIRMQQQALPSTPSTTGNIDAYTVGMRWAPFMFSRAGMAVHGEYSIAKTIGAVPLSGDGVGLAPLDPRTAVWSNSVLLAIDFAF
jgi:hypothetical protein